VITGMKTKNEDIKQLNINGSINYDLQTTPDSFNNYFLFITGKKS